MKHPKGALKEVEELEALLGKHVYMSAPITLTRGRIEFVSPNIIKLHPINIINRMNAQFILEVKEIVDAAMSNGIAVRWDLSVSWGADPLFFFSNFWLAYAHVLKRKDLREA